MFLLRRRLVSLLLLLVGVHSLGHRREVLVTLAGLGDLFATSLILLV